MDWSPLGDVIVSGGEDCRYKVWDGFGRLLFSSVTLEHPVTSVAWSPGGDKFAVGSFDCVHLCDRSGWNTGGRCRLTNGFGSVFGMGWSPDGTQLAGGGGGGSVFFAGVVGSNLEWGDTEADQVDPHTVRIRDVPSETTSTIELKDRASRLSLAHGYLVCVTTNQVSLF